MYGGGQSERALTSALRELGAAPGNVVVATKWVPFLRTAGNIARTIGNRLEALQGYPIDLYQIHLPVSFSSVQAQMREMAKLLKEGKIRTVGVSNFSARQMEAASEALAREAIVLASNQVRISLLDRRIDRNSVLETARKLGITLIAYSPLAKGHPHRKVPRQPGACRQHLTDAQGSGRSRRTQRLHSQRACPHRPARRRVAGDRKGPRRHPGAGRARLADQLLR